LQADHPVSSRPGSEPIASEPTRISGKTPGTSSHAAVFARIIWAFGTLRSKQFVGGADF